MGYRQIHNQAIWTNGGDWPYGHPSTLQAVPSMSEYAVRFRAEGFDTWEAIMDITEADLTYLGVSLIDKKKLQQEILQDRAHPPAPSSISLDRSTLRKHEPSVKKKRRYRHRPKADTHGPKHPLSAYALFANDIRKGLGDAKLSFTQISRHVGASWQLFGNGELSKWRVQAATTMEIYVQDLEKYKLTAEYREYQRYLINFQLKGPSSHSRLNRRSILQNLSKITSGGLEGSTRAEGWLSSINPSPFLEANAQTQNDINLSTTPCQKKILTPGYPKGDYFETVMQSRNVSPRTF